MFYKILKKPFFGPFMVKWRNPLSEEEQREWEEFSVKSKTGATIKGMYAPARTEMAKATIVMGHPMGKSAKGYFLKNGYTELLRNHGFNTIVFDINGFGESSTGNFAYYQDIVAVGEYARRRTPYLPLGYHGVSMGGQFSTIGFTDPTHTFRFAIIESAATSLEEFWINYPTAYKFLRFMGALKPQRAKDYRMVDRIKDVKNLDSMLLIYSKADTLTPLDMGRRFQKNSPVPTELWVVNDAKHAEIIKSKHKDAYQRKILDYFNTSVERIHNMAFSRVPMNFA